MATSWDLCLNPRCETDDPVRSFLHPYYCRSHCEWAHKGLLAVGPPRREDVVSVIGPGLARWYEAMREAKQPANPPIVHPAGVIPPEVVRSVSQDLARKQAATNLVNAVWGASDAVGVPPSKEWRVDPGLFARLRKRWLG